MPSHAITGCQNPVPLQQLVIATNEFIVTSGMDEIQTPATPQPVCRALKPSNNEALERAGLHVRDHPRSGTGVTPAYRRPSCSRRTDGWAVQVETCFARVAGTCDAACARSC